MQIFLSHSSKQKPLIREIRKGFPEHINSWLDEERLIFGDNIGDSLESVIRTETDYVLLFIDNHAATSTWVQREVDWALESEKQKNRTILLPILIDDGSIDSLQNVELRNRKFIRLHDFQESSVKALSNAITSELFALICRDMQHLRNPPPRSFKSVVSDADDLIHSTAVVVQKAAFPHRESNPILKEDLARIVHEHDSTLPCGPDFDSILSKIIQHNLIPGLIFDGYELHLREEHASWKSEIYKENKEKIGRKAASYIKSGLKVFLDAGSTTEEVARVIIKKIENRAINNIIVATTSVNIADMLSDCSVKMGFDDDFHAIKIFIPGGQVRPNTQAIIGNIDESPRQIFQLAQRLEGFDLGILGVNGVDLDAGFTTNDNSEYLNKVDIISVCKTLVIAGDTSKIGLKLPCRFAGFDDNIRFVTNTSDSAALEEIRKQHPTKVELV